MPGNAVPPPDPRRPTINGGYTPPQRDPRQAAFGQISKLLIALESDPPGPTLRMIVGQLRELFAVVEHAR